MARTVDEVHGELLALTVPGDALPHEPDSNWGLWLRPLADAIATAEARMDALLRQCNPAEAQDPGLLPDFERVLGPDPLGRDQRALSLGQRQALAAQRWGFNGGCTPGFYRALAALVGATITIEEFDSSACGAAQCGDELAPEGDQLTWRITLPATDVIEAECGVSVCGDALGQIAPSILANVIRHFSQPHLLPVFAYPA